MGIFVYQVTSFSSFSFLSHLKTKLFDGSIEKTPDSHHLFSSFPPNQTHSKKVFFIFSPKFFIYPISPQNKDTLNDLCFKIQDIFLHEMGFRPIQSLCTFRASDPSQLFQALWVMTHGLLSILNWIVWWKNTQAHDILQTK